MKNRWLLVAVAGGLLVAAFTPLPERVVQWASGSQVEAQGCSPDARQANLDFTLKDMNGAEVRLADLKGKVVLLNFWATWCGPCRLEIPAFVELQIVDRWDGIAPLIIGSGGNVMMTLPDLESRRKK